MKEYGGVEVKIHSLFSQGPYRGVWLSLISGRSTPNNWVDSKTGMEVEIEPCFLLL
jgi:hypothetical protein